MLDEEDYHKLRAKLILEGETFTKWLLDMIRKAINE